MQHASIVFSLSVCCSVYKRPVAYLSCSVWFKLRRTPSNSDCSAAWWETWVWHCLISLGGMQRASSLISVSKWRSALQTGDPSGHKPCRRWAGGTAEGGALLCLVSQCTGIPTSNSPNKHGCFFNNKLEILKRY